MQCPQCNWQNPASYTHCFSCNAPLAAAGEGPGQRGAGAAPGEARPRSKPSPTPASHAQHAQTALFPSMLARLGATPLPTQAADFHQRVAEDRRAWETVLKNVDLKGN